MSTKKFEIGLWVSISVTVLLVVVPIGPLVHTVVATPNLTNDLAFITDVRVMAYIRAMGTQLSLTVTGTVYMSVLVLSAGYGLSLMKGFRGTVVAAFFIVPLVVRGGLIPTYILVRGIGLIDHPFVLLLAERVDVLLILGSALVLGRGDAPVLREAASIDGANPVSAMLSVVLPAHPQLITTVVALSALRFWNAWFPAFLYVHSRSLIPAQNMLRSIAFRADSGIASGIAPGVETVSELYIALYALALLIPGLVITWVLRGAALSALTNNTKRKR